MYTKCGKSLEAIAFWDNTIMPQYSSRGAPNFCSSLASVIIALATLGTPAALERGESLLEQAKKNGTQSSLLVWDEYLYSAVLTMYTKCGIPQKALDFWDDIPIKKRTRSVLTCVFAACAALGSKAALERGEAILAECNNITGTPTALELGENTITVTNNTLGFGWDQYMYSALLSMYTKCGVPPRALDFWSKLPSKDYSEGVFASALAACAALGTPAALKTGAHIHTLINNSVHKNNTIIARSLMTMYTQCARTGPYTLGENC